MKNSTTRLLGVALLASSLLSASCNKDDNNNGSTAIMPKGPAPSWGPSIHNEMLTIIERLDSFNAPPIYTLTPAQARIQPSIFDAHRLVAARYGLSAPATTTDTTGMEIPVAGGSIHATIYKPRTAGSSMPGIVYYHGGGWVIATNATYDASARALSEKVGAVVVSVEYRKGPEFKFPTAHNDAFEAYKWVLNNAATLNVNPAKMAVAGESAGGNLACNVSIMARDNGVMMPKHQLLIYPVAQSDTTTASYNKYAMAKPLDRPSINWFLKHYLNTPAEAMDNRIAVSKANLSSLPPTTIINAEIDPLQDDGAILETALKAAGVTVNRKLYEGVTHEFFGFNIVLPEARQAEDYGAAALKSALQ